MGIHKKEEKKTETTIFFFLFLHILPYHINLVSSLSLQGRRVKVYWTKVAFI